MQVNKNLVYYLIIILLICVYQSISNTLSAYNTKDFIVVLNVGQGDSILIGSQNKYFLVDGGPSSSSTNSLYKYTLNNKPNSLLLTHNHSDHFSGFYNLISPFTNYDLFHTRDNFDLYNKSLRSIDILTTRSIKMGNFTIKAVSPKKACLDLNPNLCSIVLLVTHKNGDTVLLFGDAEEPVQKGLLSDLPTKVTAIKVAHHGSKDSFVPELIDKLNPKFAFISVGENNYGHPASIVEDYYKQKGAQVFRTDEYGDIVLFFD